MNRLEEYKENRAREYAPEGETMKEVIQNKGYTHRQEGFHKGFDAAIALELPVKFGIWANSLVYINGKYQNSSAIEFIDMSSAFKYWIDNIFKPE